VVAAVSLLILEGQKLVLGRPLMVFTPHDRGGILNSKGGLWVSDSCLLKYYAVLLEGSEITLRACQNLTPASFLPEGEGKP
jgi:hypothetical protein